MPSRRKIAPTPPVSAARSVSVRMRNLSWAVNVRRRGRLESSGDAADGAGTTVGLRKPTVTAPPAGLIGFGSMGMSEMIHAYGNRRALGSIVLSYASFGAAVDQEFSAFTGFAQQFRIRGSSEIIVDRAPVQLAPYQSCIMSPEAAMKVTHSHDLEHFVLKIDRDALFNKWTALTGRQPPGDLKFEPAADSRTPEAT